jgi:integrase
MPAIQNVERRCAVYYWRRTLRFQDGNSLTLRLSLRTTDQSAARRMACAMTTKSETLRMTLIDGLKTSTLTFDQKTDIFRRAMMGLRDELDRNHVEFQHSDPEDATYLIEGLVDIYEKMLGDFVVHGLPPNAGSREYVEERFAELTDDQRDGIVQLFEIKPDLAADTNEHARIELSRVGGSVEPSNIAIARKAIFEGKLAAAMEFRRRLRDPLSFYGQLTSPTGPAVAYAAPPSVASSVEIVPEPWDSLTPTQAAEKFVTDNPKIEGDGEGGKRKARWTPKTLSQFLSSARLLEKSYGAKPLHLIRHEDILKLNNHFAGLPVSHHKSPRHGPMSLEEICAETAAALAANKMPKSAIGLNATTTNRHFQFLRELITWMRRSVPSMSDLKWDDFIFPDDRDARDQRDAYTVEEGRAMFRLPIWTGARSASHRLEPGIEFWHDAAYWVILIAWYTGLRRQEICQLRLADVTRQEGVWSIEVHARDGNKVKNNSSKRFVPLAEELLRLGLIGYADALRGAGETWLFPELQSESGEMRQGDVFYKNVWMKIAPHLDFVEPGQAIHAFRHTVATQLKDQRIFEEERADLIGHTLQGETAGRYSKAASILRLKEVVDKIPVVTDRLKFFRTRLLPSHLRQPRRQRVTR